MASLVEGRVPADAGSLLALLPLLLLVGCVSDPKIEEETPPPVGAIQPGSTGGATLTADVACQKLVEAEKAARQDLGCDVPETLECPGYVRWAGATPCDEYDESTVEACVAAITEHQGVKTCAGLEQARCVATLVQGSCRTPVAPEAGTPDGGDASPGADGGADAALPSDGGIEAAPASDARVTADAADGAASSDAAIDGEGGPAAMPDAAPDAAPGDAGGD